MCSPTYHAGCSPLFPLSPLSLLFSPLLLLLLLSFSFSLLPLHFFNRPFPFGLPNRRSASLRHSCFKDQTIKRGECCSYVGSRHVPSSSEKKMRFNIRSFLLLQRNFPKRNDIILFSFPLLLSKGGDSSGEKAISTGKKKEEDFSWTVKSQVEIVSPETLRIKRGEEVPDQLK